MLNDIAQAARDCECAISVTGLSGSGLGRGCVGADNIVSADNDNVEDSSCTDGHTQTDGGAGLATAPVVIATSLSTTTGLAIVASG